MPLKTPYEKYQENMIFSSSPEELTLMLYNGLVKFIAQAQLAIEKKDMARVHDCIVKAKKILINFENTLDMEYEVSKDLLPLYEYMEKRLTEANIKKDKTILEEVLGLSEEMRNTWSKAMEVSTSQNKVLNGNKR